MTVLVVEDSRYASEALRLLCLKSGARIRRADSLRAARKHLASYMPTVLIVDIGLPDGTGHDIIRDVDAASPRIPAVIATSGEEAGFAKALELGADATLLKPLKSLASFQETVLGALPEELRHEGLRLISAEEVDPDPIALKDDFAHIAEVISDASDDTTVDYVAQFITGVARTAGDSALEDAAVRLGKQRLGGEPVQVELAAVADLLKDRLARQQTI
jgi:DNA-binding NarL/FixJ family response regulator